MKLNLIKEIFSSGLTSKFMGIMIVKSANLSFADSLTLSSTKPIINKTIKEQININADKCFCKPKVSNIGDLLTITS
jgi:hypothetical protein